MNDIRELLGKKRLYFDGGMGSLLQARGLKPGELPETWNILHPNIIEELHSTYLESGADIINANTFGANLLHYPDNLEEIVQAGVSIAVQARNKTKPDAFVTLDIGPLGKLLKPMGDLDFEEAVRIFARTVEIGARCGADVVLIETMTDPYETKAAVLAAKEHCDLPVFVTFTLEKNGRMMTGGTIPGMVAMLEGLRVDAIGFNCSLGPREMIPFVKELCAYTSLPVIVNPNAGLPVTRHGMTFYEVEADEFAALMKEISACGVQVAGGCCGTTPKHIKRLRETLEQTPLVPITKKNISLVSSYARYVEINDTCKVIGERINPTGKKLMKQALKDHDIGYLLKEALRQESDGAHILDVNVGLPGIDEPSVLEEATFSIQEITDLPLQLDSSNPVALEKAMRIYNGKPMINSVTGKQESMDAIFPLVQKYGGVLVALALDENGIPATAQGRIDIAKKIIAEAAKYGIEKKDLVIDGLTMTISHDNANGMATLETIHRLHDELGCRTILGVSNVSFGLPQRNLVNASFLSMAMLNGLSAAIINPSNGTMMAAYRSSLSLLGQDPACASYIEAYANTSASDGAPIANKSTVSSGVPNTLGACIRKGLADEAAAIAAKELAGGALGLDLINNELIPALDEVGKGFEKGTLYLPQLLMSADAAKAVFALIKESLSGETKQIKGRIILATVKGDIHDIGKNIVKVMLENYGYEVLDLGKDVAPETIVETAIAENIRLVGLSALMTTTVPSMEETIRLLKQKKPDTLVIVGGAVLTEDYAKAIHADAYGKDAMATVRYADSVFQ